MESLGKGKEQVFRTVLASLLVTVISTQLALLTTPNLQPAYGQASTDSDCENYASLGGETYTVGTGGDYARLNDALKVSLNGDLVIVLPGNYDEVAESSSDITIMGCGPQTRVYLLEISNAVVENLYVEDLRLGSNGVAEDISADRVSMGSDSMARHLSARSITMKSNSILEDSVVGSAEEPGRFSIDGAALVSGANVIADRIQMKGNGFSVADSKMVSKGYFDIEGSGFRLVDNELEGLFQIRASNGAEIEYNYFLMELGAQRDTSSFFTEAYYLVAGSILMEDSSLTFNSFERGECNACGRPPLRLKNDVISNNIFYQLWLQVEGVDRFTSNSVRDSTLDIAGVYAEVEGNNFISSLAVHHGEGMWSGNYYSGKGNGLPVVIEGEGNNVDRNPSQSQLEIAVIPEFPSAVLVLVAALSAAAILMRKTFLTRLL